MERLIDGAAAHVTSLGGTIRTGRPVTRIESDGERWRVDGEHFDAIVIASPARPTAPLLADVAPEASAALARFEHADVIMVRLTIAADQWPEQLVGRSGYLVPKPDQHTVTAASFASQKWAHWAPSDGSQILRVSLGRDGLPVADLDDEGAIRATVDEVGHHLGFDMQPGETSVTRWISAFPQYRPHHRRLVSDVERSLPITIAIAGASYHGIGIPACIAGAQRAAARIKQSTTQADDLLT